MNLLTDIRTKAELARWLLRLLFINSCATLCAVLILYWFTDQRSYIQVKSNLIGSFIYSNCIGSLVSLFFPLLLHYCSRYRFPVNNIVVLLAMSLLAGVGCFIGTGLLVLLGQYSLQQFWPQFFFCVKLGLIITAGFGFSLYTYHSLQLKLAETALQLRTRELAEERALKLAAEARLSLLASRIHPHFLFNTLNSISALIQEDPPLAERLIERLAALLRFSLDANNRNLVPLQQELKIVTDYLEIERARFGKRLNYSIEQAGELGALMLPPLSLQTLVENSVKYAVANSRSGATITIIAGRCDNNLQLAVSDNGPGFTSQQIIPGHGLDILQSRLAALFGTAAKLDIAALSQGSKVTLLVPQTAQS